MKSIENICTSLELSKRLKELGVKQNSILFWFKQFEDSDYLLHYIDYNHHEEDLKIFLKNFPDSFAAFTASELLEKLPTEINGNRWELLKDIELFSKPYLFGYHKMICFCGENPQKAMAKMLIHLIENKIIDVNVELFGEKAMGEL